MIDDRLDAERLQALAQPRVANGVRTHVDAAPVRSEVHRHADDVDAVDDFGPDPFDLEARGW